MREITKYTGEFVGGKDVGRMAKERQAIASAGAGLADIVAATLNVWLEGGSSSNSWDDPQLPAHSQRFAALRAFACLRIFQKLADIPIPEPINPGAPPGTPVQLYQQDRSKFIARGTISTHASSALVDGINITATRTVMEVSEVLVPSAIINTHKKKTLESFQQPPFTLVVYRDYLRTIPPFTPPQPPQAPSHSSRATRAEGDTDDPPPPPSLPEGGSLMNMYDSMKSLSVVDQDEGGLSSGEPQTERISDSEAAEYGVRVMEGNVKPVFNKIRSRVLKDVFHVFQMLYISQTHGLRVPFSQALSAAMLIPDPDDHARLEAWGLAQNPPLKWDQMVQYRPTWLWRRCRRSIPPPEHLYPIVLEVFKTWGPLKDAKTGRPLFNTSAWAASKNILELIRQGYVSDPPGIPLYSQITIDKDGLPIHRCHRGTGGTENWHTHLRRHLPDSGVGLEHMDCRIKDVVTVHNLIVRLFFLDQHI